MKAIATLCALTLWLIPSMGYGQSQSCAVVNSFSGLIFDAGAFVGPSDMEAHLDRALTYGVEKVVLFPHPAAEDGSRPMDLEETFPDLVVRGVAPWNNAPAVIWPEPISPTMIADLEKELVRNPERPYLLGNVTRFNLKTLQKWVKAYPNLWIGFGKPEIDQLVETCVSGPLADLMKAADQRVVFASFGMEEGWKNYKWTIRKLKKLSSYLGAGQADGLLFKNAERLYRLAVNAP